MTINPNDFINKFGIPMTNENIIQLMKTKSLNISRLLEICPIDTVDPSPHLYDSTMQTLGTMMCLAVVAHGLVRPLPLPLPLAVPLPSTTTSATTSATVTTATTTKINS